MRVAFIHAPTPPSRALLYTHTLSRVEKLGYSVPVFDFRLPGVTSMSADIHKYGLGTKVRTIRNTLF